MRRQDARDDAGFTLIELTVAIVVMGILLVPLANFVIQYLDNVNTTRGRLNDSASMQLVAAYVSQDIGNMGTRDAGGTLQPYIFAPPTGAYCGSALGTPVLLVKSDDWTYNASTNTGSLQTHSVLYFMSAGSLGRAECATGTTVTGQSNLADDVQSTLVACTGPNNDSTCDTSTTNVSLTLTLRSLNDPAQTVILSGQRRQGS
jgi:prepilin-type N-terminal cleavage/methylation domain-containing protein